MNWKVIQRQFRTALKSLLPTRYIGWTGWPDGTIYDDSRPNYIRVVLQDGSKIEAWNDGVPTVVGLQIDLYSDPVYPGLLRAKQPRLSFSRDFPFVCIRFHRDNHTWPGPDTVAVELRQFMPLHPSVNGFVLTVRAGWVETTDGLKFFASESVDLSSYKPASGARYVLVSIGDDGLLTITSGTVKDLYSLVIGDIPERPLGHQRICAVRLHIGQAYIKDEKQNPDLLDLRFISSLDGDMLKSVYDPNDDGIVDSAEKVDGVDTAGNDKYYGTNSAGEPGFYDLPVGGISGSLDLGQRSLINFWQETNAQDDHFNASTLSTDWYVSSGTPNLALPGWVGGEAQLTKPIPSGDWAIYGRFIGGLLYSLCLGENQSFAVGYSARYLAYMSSYSNMSMQFQRTYNNNYNTQLGPVWDSGGPFRSLWFSIQKVGSNYYTRYSDNGVVYFQFCQVGNIGFTPAYFGIYLASQDDYCDFFMVRS